MTPLIILAVIAVVLWLLVFISRRRFGTLALALFAGSVIGPIWKADADILIASTGIFASGLVTDAVVLCVLILLPSLVLIFGGATHKNPLGRLLSATFFVVLALTLLIEPIGMALPVVGPSAEVVKFLREYKGIILSLALILAVVDILLAKGHHSTDKSKK